MKILRSWQCYFLSILAVPSFADSSISVDDLSLMIYGASVHTQCTESQSDNGKPCDFSYWNPGLGLDWAFGGTVISVNCRFAVAFIVTHITIGLILPE